MEIEHLATVRDISTERDNAVAMTDDWRAMDRHFSMVRAKCPALEGVGASEAIHSWLDYHAPEPIILLKSPCLPHGGLGQTSLVRRFPLHFLGEGILGDEERMFHLRVPLAFSRNRKIRLLRILKDKECVSETLTPRSGAFDVDLALSLQNRQCFALEVEFCGSPRRVNSKSEPLAYVNP